MRKMSTFKKVILSAFVLLTIHAGSYPIYAQQESLSQLGAYIKTAMAEWNVPGLAIGVVHDDKVIFEQGFGVRDLRGNDPVDTETLFAIASNTKAFTTMALGLLVQEGKISWDDPVLKYLPDFQLYDPVVTRKITIRDLLCHRSGLGTWAGDLTWWNSKYDRREVMRRIRFQQPVSDFRTVYHYSNLMFLVAGQIIPSVTKTGWDQYIQRNFFDRLNMRRSDTSVTALSHMDNVATPHSMIDGKLAPIEYLNVDNCAPAGAINSCIDDLIQWLRLRLGRGVYNGKRLVDSAVIDEMRTPQILIHLSRQQRKLRPSTHFSDYALGLRLNDYQGRLVVNHTGGLDGMFSYIGLMPEENLGVIVLTNSDNQTLYRALPYYVFDAVLGIDGPDWSERYLKVYRQNQERQKAQEQKRIEQRVKDTKPSHPMSAYAGTYTEPVYGSAHISQDDGKLTLSLSAHPGFAATLTHWQYDTFLAKWNHPLWRESYVSFSTNEQGRITGFTTSVRPDWIDTREYDFHRAR